MKDLVRKPFMILGVALIATGCAFRSSGDSQLVQCKTDDDCAEFRRCSPITATCEMQAPAPEPLKIQGPFDCTVGDIVYSGVNLSAAWPAFSSNGVAVPAGSAQISNRCSFIAGATTLEMIFQGARQYQRIANSVAFFELAFDVPTTAAALGARQVAPSWSGVYLCPTGGLTADGGHLAGDPYWHFGTEDAACIRAFTVPQVSLTITRKDGSNVAGYLIGALTPNVAVP